MAFIVLVGVWQFNQAKSGGGMFGGRGRGRFNPKGGGADFTDDPQVRETIRQFRMQQRTERGGEGGGGVYGSSGLGGGASLASRPGAGVGMGARAGLGGTRGGGGYGRY